MGKIKDAFEEFFGNTIYTYTREQAIEDGWLAEVGTHAGRKIVFTTNLLSKFEKHTLLYALLVGLSTIEKDDTDEYLFPFVIGGTEVWATRDSQAYTFMLPEDY